MMWKLTVYCASASTRKEAPTRSRYCWLGLRLNWTFWRLVHESGREACLSFKHRDGRRLKCCFLQVTIIIFLSVVGALLFYMLFLLLVEPLIRKPDPLAQTLHNEEDSEVTARIRVFSGFQLVCKSLKWLNVCILMCLFSGNAPTSEQRHTERKHGPGAGGGCTAALEEAGPGATQDCLRPP